MRFKDWLPRNFDRDHQGAVTVRRALQQSLNVPAVLALEKVGPQRFISTLRAAGAVPGLPPGDAGDSLGIALGSATVSPLEMAGLYAGLANGGRFAAAAGAPRPAAARAGAADRRRRPPGMSATCWPTRRCPTASPRCRSRCASGASPTRPAPRPVSATPGRRATAPTGRSWCGSAMPTARRGPASSAALAALPILFKAFGRLPGEDNRAQPAAGRRAARRLVSGAAAAHAHPGAGAAGRGRAAHRLSAGRRAARARRARGGARSPPRAATAGCAGWSTAGRSTAPAGCPTVPARCALAVVDEAGHSSAVTVRIVRRPLTASATDASSSTAKATLIDPVGARIAEEARQQRAGQQPQHVDAR